MSYPRAPAVWLHTYGMYLVALFSCVSRSILVRRKERNILPGWFHLPAGGSDAVQNTQWPWGSSGRLFPARRSAPPGAMHFGRMEKLKGEVRRGLPETKPAHSGKQGVFRRVA